ncbi:uncharacterized protein QC761_0005400 [Podospora bellae-mahoneyi]|uniref:Uncharacterized protein n=1 Tax=Podospora bellae-mahoneyi TaxID=2093777 RepID=A0ABR0FV88_9PEZI|nr:hypothetical protein QC761_0005400 [Podospora bellae-mahoneyi]
MRTSSPTKLTSLFYSWTKRVAIVQSCAAGWLPFAKTQLSSHFSISTSAVGQVNVCVPSTADFCHDNKTFLIVNCQT